MTEAYDKKLREILFRAGKISKLKLQRGVYLAVSGPSYETPAEIRAFATLGADAVGMSTVPEAIALRHMGVRVGALSCVSNLAAGLSVQTLDHADVEATMRSRGAILARLVARWVERVGAPS